MTVSYFNLQKFCAHDGPGIRTTVFLKGCPLRCRWCHNPESQKISPELFFLRSKCTSCGRCLGLCDARTMTPEGMQYDRSKCTVCGKCVNKCFRRANTLWGKTGQVDEILQEVLKDKIFYETSGGGMTISGGEPSAQPEAVIELVEKARAMGIHTAIETCGSGAEDFYRRLAELDVLFLFDIKGIDPEKHFLHTGYGVERIHKNLDLLISLGARIILRLPLIPHLNDTDEDLLQLRAFLQQKGAAIEYAEIMPYHRLGEEKRRALDLEENASIPDGRQFVDRWLSFLEPAGIPIRVSGS